MKDVYVPETKSNDSIFLGANIFNHNLKKTSFASSCTHYAEDDEHYTNYGVKTYVFTDSREEDIYYVVDGIPNKTIYKPMHILRDTLKLPKNSVPGVYIIKVYNITTRADINTANEILDYWNYNNPSMSEDILIKIKHDMQTHISTGAHFKNDFKIRLVNFISMLEFKTTSLIHNKLLNGYLTRRLGNYDVSLRNLEFNNSNTIKIDIPAGDAYEHWMIVGSMVIPLKTTYGAEKKAITILNGNDVVACTEMKVLEDFGIYDSQKEAYNNIASNILKSSKLDLEHRKINLEHSKLSMDSLKITLERSKLSYEESKLKVDKERLVIDYKKMLLSYEIESVKSFTNDVNTFKEVAKAIGTVFTTVMPIFKQIGKLI